MQFLRFLGAILPFVAPSPATIPAIEKPKDKVSRILDTAADLLKENGWTQNTFIDLQGKLCAVEAIERATYHHSNFLSDKTALAFNARRKLNKYIGGDSDIIFWNDDEGRTKEEVITALREAARI